MFKIIIPKTTFKGLDEWGLAILIPELIHLG